MRIGFNFKFDRLWIVPVLGLAGCIITTGGGDSDTESQDTDATATSPTGDSASSGVLDGGSDGASGGADAGQSANERCDDLCTQLVEAGCDNGPTQEGCALTCEALTSAAVCDASAQAYMDCVDDATVTCNAQGEPVAAPCGLLYLVAIGCAVTENPNPEIVEPCADYCDNTAAAECPANGTVEDCNTNCLWVGATGTGCDSQWASYLECFNATEVSCVLGFAVGEGCGPDFDAYWTCINAG